MLRAAHADGKTNLLSHFMATVNTVHSAGQLLPTDKGQKSQLVMQRDGKNQYIKSAVLYTVIGKALDITILLEPTNVYVKLK